MLHSSKSLVCRKFAELTAPAEIQRAHSDESVRVCKITRYIHTYIYIHMSPNELYRRIYQMHMFGHTKCARNLIYLCECWLVYNHIYYIMQYQKYVWIGLYDNDMYVPLQRYVSHRICAYTRTKSSRPYGLKLCRPPSHWRIYDFEQSPRVFLLLKYVRNLNIKNESWIHQNTFNPWY